MIVYHPKTAPEAAALRREHADTAVYLAGGTDDLRLGSEASGKDLIDLNALGMDQICLQGDKLVIGARCTFHQLIEHEAVPEFVKEAARFCASFVKRNSATVGGNLGLRRDDAYLSAALTAAEAVLTVQTPKGVEQRPVGEYLQSDCKALITEIVLDAGRTGWVRRFGNTAQSHAALIAAESSGVYALSVHGSGLVYGSSPEIAEQLSYMDDLTGGAEYKKYLAKTVFEQKEAK